ncbi:MAG TPA: DOPA 4,5-dioxygenase family protein [Stellaceae bacterium]|nr:DOPA 4,5-dioxygenase family protein [Stellaceae bacterium]HEX3415623.1 DOPA 4,5-dioxygenase family protein [Stellaceae bacterium]
MLIARAVADAQPPGLDVLVHPVTDNSGADHSRYAVWLGSPVPLKLNTTGRT